MKLGIKERMALFDLLPQTGGFGTALIIRSLREKLEFSVAESEVIKLETTEVPVRGPGGIDTGQVMRNTSWDPEHAKDQWDINFSKAETSYIKKLVGELAKQERLPEVLTPIAVLLFPDEFVAPG